MKVTQLKIDTDADAATDVTIWVTCTTVEDIDDVAAWLELAKDFVAGWREVRAKRTNRPATVTPIKGKTP
jgi:hypothetical protein